MGAGTHRHCSHTGCGAKRALGQQWSSAAQQAGLTRSTTHRLPKSYVACDVMRTYTAMKGFSQEPSRKVRGGEKNGTHGVALLVERDVAGVVDLDDRVVRAVDVCEALRRRLGLVQPPYVACIGGAFVSFVEGKTSLRYRLTEGGVIVATRRSVQYAYVRLHRGESSLSVPIPTLEESLPGVVLHELVPERGPATQRSDRCNQEHQVHIVGARSNSDKVQM